MLQLIIATYGLSTIVGLAMWLSMPFVLAMIAEQKGRSQFWAFFCGLFLTVPATIYYLAAPSLKPVRVISVVDPGTLPARELVDRKPSVHPVDGYVAAFRS